MFFELLDQGFATVELPDAAIGRVENQPFIVRGVAQHETAGQGCRGMTFDSQQDTFGEHRRALLTARGLGGQFQVTEPFEILLRKSMGFAQVDPEPGGLQGFGKKQWDARCRHRRISNRARLRAHRV
ncbi:hypothetical protein D3C84_860400 [compost metagenome]